MLFWLKAEKENLKIEAEENLQQHIVTEVSGGKLKISVEKGYSLQTSRNYDITDYRSIYRH